MWSRSGIVPLALMLATGCVAMGPPVKNGGPALSEKGLQLAVLRQDCSQTREPNEYGWDLVDATIEVQVRNLSPEPAVVQRDRFRLLTPDGYALRTITWRSAEPLTIAGGASETFPLRFMTRGGLACSKEMRLDPDGGIALREHPVALQPISFVPYRGAPI